MNNRLIKYLAYKPQHHENPLFFWIGRIFYTFQQDYYEAKVKPVSYKKGENLKLEEIEKCLLSEIRAYLTKKEPDGKDAFCHIRSFQNGRHAHNMLATKTFCKAMAYRYEATGEKEYLDALCEGARYLISHKCKGKCNCGLYKYQLPIGLPQDEGPTTAGAIQVLCEAYRFSKEETFREEAIRAALAAKKILRHVKLGYRHTLGYEVQTTNINSSFAHSFAMLYRITEDEKWRKEAIWCMEKTVELQNQDGMFYYTDKRRQIFISLYHYMVVNALVQVCELCNVEDPKIRNCVDRAVAYGKTLVDQDGFILEPDRSGIRSDFHSCTRGALMFALVKDIAQADQIIQRFGDFFHDHTACTTINHEDRLSDGNYWYRRERHLIDAYCDVAQLMLVMENEKQ